jgi:hypothetical protein
MEVDMPTSQIENAYVNVSVPARELGFTLPVMISYTVHFRLLPDEVENAAGESYLHRLLEVLSLAVEAVKVQDRKETRTAFHAYLHERTVTGHWLTSRVELWCCRQGKGYVIGLPEDRGL